MATLRLNVDSSGVKAGADAFKRQIADMKAAVVQFGAMEVEAQNRITKLAEAARSFDTKTANEQLRSFVNGALSMNETLEASKKIIDNVSPKFKTLGQFAYQSAGNFKLLQKSGDEAARAVRDAVGNTMRAVVDASGPLKAYSDIYVELGDRARVTQTALREVIKATADQSKALADPIQQLQAEVDLTSVKLPFLAKQIQQAFGLMGKSVVQVNEPVLRTAGYMMRMDESFTRAIPTVKKLSAEFERFLKKQAWEIQVNAAESLIEALGATSDQSAYRLWNLTKSQDANAESLKKLASVHAEAVKNLAKMREEFAKDEATQKQVRAAYEETTRAASAYADAKKVAAQRAQPFGAGLTTKETSGDFGAGILTVEDRMRAGVVTLRNTSSAIEQITDDLNKQEEAARLDTIAFEKYLATLDRAQYEKFKLAGQLAAPRAPTPAPAFGAGLGGPSGAAATNRGNALPFGAGAFDGAPKRVWDLSDALRSVNERTAALSKEAPPRIWNLNNALANVNKRTAELSKGSQDLAKGLGDISLFGGSARSVVSQLFLGFSAIFAIREAVTGTARALSEFDTAMQTVSAVTHITGKELDDVEKLVRKFGAASTYGAGKAADAFVELVKAGLDSKEALAALPGTLNFATVAQVSLAEAAKLTSTTLRQFSIDARETERAMDAMTIVANSTITSVTPLSEAMKNVGPIAADMGNSIEEVAAALGTLAERNLQGGAAGTKLRGIMLALTSPTREAQIAIEELRDSTTGARLSLEQLDPRAHTISEIFKTLGRSNFDAATSAKLFNDRFAAAGLVLARNSERISELINKQKELSGETKRNADVINDSLGKSYEKFKAAVEELILSMGDNGLKGSLKAIVHFSTQVVLALSDFEDPAHKISLAAKLVANSIEAVTLAVAGLAATKMITWLVETQFGLATLKATVDAVRLAWIGYAEAQTLATAATATSAIGAALSVAAGAAVLLITSFNDLADAGKDVDSALISTRENIEKLYKAENDLVAARRSQKIFDEREALRDQAAAIKQQVQDIKKAYAEYQVAFDLFRKDPANNKAPSLSETAFGDLDAFVKGSDRATQALESARAGLASYQAYRDSLAKSGQQFDVMNQYKITDFVNVTPLEILNIALEDTQKKIGAVNYALKNGQPVREEGEAFIEAASALEKKMAALDLKIKIAEKTKGMSERDARDMAELLTLEEDLRSRAAGKEKDQIEELIAQYEKKYAIAQRDIHQREDENEAIKKREAALKVFERELQQLRDRAQVASENYDEQKKEAEVLKLTNLAREAGLTLTTREKDEIRELVDAVEQSVAAHKQENKELNAHERAFNRLREKMMQLAEEQDRTEQSAKNFVDRYKALAETIDQSSEAQDKASVLARFDAKTKGLQTFAIEGMRKALEKYLDTIAKGDNTAVMRGIEEVVKRYEMQADSLEQSADDHRREAASLELENAARGHAIEGMDTYESRLKKALDTITRYEDRGRDKNANNIVRGMQNELELLMLTNDEREKRTRLQQLEAISDQGFVSGLEEKRKQIELLSQQIVFQSRMKELSTTIANDFTGSLEDAVFQVKSLGEAFRALGRDIIQALFRSQVSQPIGGALQGGLNSFFSSMFGGGSPLYGPPPPPGGGNYDGGVFEDGSMRRMALGGIVEDYSVMQGKNGGRFSIAERAPEGVLPLERVGGKLGVNASGLGGGGTQINMTVYANDANSFNKSRTQIIRDMKREMR